LAESLRSIIAESKFKIVGNITCSFGIASTSDNNKIELLTELSDDALYKAKTSGRNCVRYFNSN
ncbi:MAG: diguanylate cyclase, partial [Spirochaetales bacterium]|nr:diguanylate cyclase [Spirochaetales bacterium]